MRRGHDNGWLKDDMGRLVAVNLGADFTAEHEWGIKGIQQSFGISADLNVFGIQRRAITAIPQPKKSYITAGEMTETICYREWGLKNRKNPPGAALIFDRHGNAERHINILDGSLKVKHSGSMSEIYLPEFNPRWEKSKTAEDPYYTFSTAWDEGSFGIHVKGLGNVNQLREIWEALQKKDLGIWTGGGHVFQRAGLVLGIISRCRPQDLETMRAADEGDSTLKKASEDIGIHKELTAKGKQWFALSPKWAKGFKDMVTAFPVVYWLNPYHQDKDNYGYFTVEQLKEWGDGKGDIPKTADQLAKRNG